MTDDRRFEIEQAHDHWNIRWPDGDFQAVAVQGLRDRASLVWTVCELENPEDMFLLLLEP